MWFWICIDCENFYDVVDFGVDGDIDGEVVGSFVDIEEKGGDENEMGGSFVEGGFSQDDKVNEELFGKEVVFVVELLEEFYVG